MKRYSGKVVHALGQIGLEDADGCITYSGQWFEGICKGNPATVHVETASEHAALSRALDELSDASVKLSEAAVAVAEGGSLARRKEWREEFYRACSAFDGALAKVREVRG